MLFSVYLLSRKWLILHKSHSHHWKYILFLKCHTLSEREPGFLKDMVQFKGTQKEERGRDEHWLNISEILT